MDVIERRRNCVTRAPHHVQLMAMKMRCAYAKRQSLQVTMCGHALNYTLTEGYTRLDLGIRKPKSSGLIGAWPPAPPRLQPVKLHVLNCCMLASELLLSSEHE
eukprot:6202562-Pleurochrysis_carterae.AAC.4